VKTTQSPDHPQLGLDRTIHCAVMNIDRQSLEANRFLLCGCGDQGDLGESSSHPKLLEVSIDLGSAKRIARVSASRDNRLKIDSATSLDGKHHNQGQIPMELSNHGQGTSSEEGKNWSMEVYKGPGEETETIQKEEEFLELDLDEVEAEISMQFMAIGVFYSHKSYSLKFLFSDMLNAWGIPRLASVEKLGDYCFKLEFIKEEDKKRLVDGGPWRHKGDTLIVVHYDGLTRPSEVHIESIGL
jgi:hypothetical protein